MFTVKHCQNGIENLYPNVIAATYRGPNAQHGPHGLEIILQEGHRMHLFEGNQVPDSFGSSNEQTIYVMNENGKTIATYRLEGQNPYAGQQNLSSQLQR